MSRLHNPKLVENASQLRHNQTKEEKRLWYECLQKLPQHFSRQKVLGDYIVDFYCASAKLVIELDGSQHYEDENKEKDKIRDRYLESLGLTVVRYSNIEIHNNFKGVCEDIYNRLEKS